MIPTCEQFYRSVVDIKEHLLESDLSKISADNLEKLFHYFQVEYRKLCVTDRQTINNDRVKSITYTSIDDGCICTFDRLLLFFF
jgi:hypothetical protein